MFYLNVVGYKAKDVLDKIKAGIVLSERSGI